MSKTKRALPEDIDITDPREGIDPAELAHDEEQARAEMQLWDAANTVRDKLWLGTMVLSFTDSHAEYTVAIISEKKPTPKQVLFAVCVTTSHSYDTIEFGYDNPSDSMSISAWSKPLKVTEQVEAVSDIPF